jgi:hypothetical protein
VSCAPRADLGEREARTIGHTESTRTRCRQQRRGNRRCRWGERRDFKAGVENPAENDIGVLAALDDLAYHFR